MAELSLSITDLAIIEEAERLGIPDETSPPILREETFGGGGRKTGMVVRDRLDGPVLYLIGAPEEVIARADDADAGLQEALDVETAKGGRRVIAVAHRTLARTEPGQSADDLEQHLTLDGLIAIEDPPRPGGVRETITRMARAGIRTIMVTGGTTHGPPLQSPARSASPSLGGVIRICYLAAFSRQHVIKFGKNCLYSRLEGRGIVLENGPDDRRYVRAISQRPSSISRKTIPPRVLSEMSVNYPPVLKRGSSRSAPPSPPPQDKFGITSRAVG